MRFRRAIALPVSAQKVSSSGRQSVIHRLPVPGWLSATSWAETTVAVELLVTMRGPESRLRPLVGSPAYFAVDSGLFSYVSSVFCADDGRKKTASRCG